MALTSAPSFSSDAMSDKKYEEGRGRAVLATDPTLGAIGEDMDEGAQLAGEVAQTFTDEEMNAVRRKIDLRMVPLLAAVYFSQFLDKNSINYSSVMGLPIKGEHYNLVTMAFYLGFLIFEMPQSSLSAKFPRAKFLGVNMLLWAASLILHSATAIFGVFFLFRFLLGAFECVVSPILIAMVAMWYKKSEQSKRIGAFYVCNGITQILGGLMAWGITHYKGDDVAHWRIIYFLLGGLAFVVAIAVLIWLPDSIASAKFLTTREKEIALERVRDNASGTVSYTFKKEQAKEAFTDIKVWMLCLCMATVCVPNAAITSFTSILLKTSLGYTSQEALIMNMPCGAVAIVTTLTVCYIADKKHLRMLPYILSIIPSIIGMGLLVGFSKEVTGAQNRAALLAGILLSQCFVSGIALLYSWSAANIGGSTKKAVVNAMMLIAFGGGNLAGSQAFQAKDAPQYLPGKIALLVLLLVTAAIAVGMHVYIGITNRRKADALAELVQQNGWTEEDVQREKDKLAFADLSDTKNVFFTYVQ
ncbi:hypothetical protein JCM8547_008873 [Rhodosporidiobolus lusitaniae]